MKKKVARLLVLVMFLSIFQGMSSVQAAEDVNMGFAVTKRKLKETSQGLALSSREAGDEETALAEWDIKTAGKYELNYFIEAMESGQTVTKMIKVDLLNRDGSNIDTTISILEDGVAKPVSYTPRLFKNDSFVWQDGPATTSSAINIPLKVGAQSSRNEQEYNVAINNVSMVTAGSGRDNLRLRIKVTTDKIYFYTNGIAKGNITPFELKVDGSPVKATLFNGPKEYTIVPTHLLLTPDGKISSQNIIPDISTVKPGSKPGVKLSFKMLKEVKNTGKFDYIDGSAAEQITLNLGTKHTAQENNSSIRLDFKPKSGDPVIVNSTTTETNAVEVTDHTVSLYLAKDTLSGSPPTNIIEWDALQTSTIVDGSWEYGKWADKYQPTYNGYTYLGYSLNKTNSNQVQLSINPYNIPSRATYNIYVLTNSDTQATNPHMIYEYDPNRGGSKTITAVVPSNTPNWFKIEVNIDKNTYISQIVYYDPANFPTTPPVTQITSIDNVYVVPSESSMAGAQPQAIGFEGITWKAPSDLLTILQEGDLYYELLLRKDKEDLDPITNTNNVTDDKYAIYSKIFKVSLQGGKPVVTVVGGTAGETYGSQPEVRYDSVNRVFTMEDVSLMNYGVNGKWEQIKLTENHLAKTAGEYRTMIDDVMDDTNNKRLNTLENRVVPGTYYLSFRTVLASHIDAKPIVYSEESNLRSLSLDNTKEIVPVPTKITGVDTTDNNQNILSYKVNVGNVDIKNYVKKMLEPAYYYLHDGSASKLGRYSGEYEVYLYQEKDKLAQTMSKVDNKTLIPTSLTTGAALDLKDTWNNSTYVDALRKGEVVVFTVKSESMRGAGEESIQITGLDPNQVYYIQIRTKLSPWRGSPSDKVPARYSLLSREFTFTTTTKPLPPSPEDKTPPAPQHIWIEEQPNNTSAILGWAPAEFEEDGDVDKVYYEFIRSDRQLTSGEQKQKVEELVEVGSDWVGFRSDSPIAAEPYMSTYTSKDKNWTKLTPEQAASRWRLTDDTLSPNAVYYYYERTVFVIEGQAVKSSWIMVPVTTSPVSPPIHLKVEAAKDYSHNPKKEIVISFDAPIPEGATIPNDYAFDFAIQGEEDTSYLVNHYSITQVTVIPNTGQLNTGYTRYVYKITDLKPNRRYNIKVRIVDRTKTLENNGQYPTSLYCDAVSTRTEYDEDEQDKDNRFEEYLKKYESEVEKLKRNPYWDLEKGYTYKYRQSYLEADLGIQREYELVTGEDAASVVYYLPAAIMVDNPSDTILNITLGQYKASIRPYTLVRENEAVKEALEQIDLNKIEDYYVSVEFAVDTTLDSIHGEKALTPELYIDMELVYSKETESFIESEIMDELVEIIDEEKNNLIKDLEEELYKNKTIDIDALEELIEDKVTKIKKEHAKRAKRTMERYTTSHKTITELGKAILLASEVDAFAASAYHYTGSWTAVESYNTGSVFYIEANELGLYILTGQKSLIDTVPTLAPYQSFISKYTLTDFFTLNGYMIKTAATKEQVYGATARMLGARRGVDYAIFLKNKGLKGVSGVGMTLPIRQDEAIYIAMQTYEKLYNRPIASISIKNRQSVRNIGAFQNIYRNYVYAAVELKIVENPNSQVLPSKQMTVEEIIRMLYKVQAR